MKDVLFWLLLAAVAYLAYDDYSKRNELQQTQAQVQLLSLNYQRQNTARVMPRMQPTPALPGWFQKHLDQGTSLEQSRPHRHEDELGAATPFPSPH